jgi:hypothetical protein
LNQQRTRRDPINPKKVNPQKYFRNLALFQRRKSDRLFTAFHQHFTATTPSKKRTMDAGFCETPSPARRCPN